MLLVYISFIVSVVNIKPSQLNEAPYPQLVFAFFKKEKRN